MLNPRSLKKFIPIAAILATAVWAMWPRPLPPPPQSAPANDPLTIVLVEHMGSGSLDAEIRDTQERVTSHAETAGRHLEKLGRLFITKARMTGDPGCYKLAEQCAVAIEAAHPGHPDALLLRGHVAAALHHFREAEELARRLVAQREFVLDHALLGDALMEQGRLDEAVTAYQTMIDLKPCLPTYCRVAHVRWLKGDLEGAIEMMDQAISTGSDREREPLAWAYTRLAGYTLQRGDLDAADRAAQRALDLIPDYSSALLARGRVALARRDFESAAAVLTAAALRNPLPEYLWAQLARLRTEIILRGYHDYFQRLAASA